MYFFGSDILATGREIAVLTSTEGGPLSRADVAEDVIPQRGLTKEYQYERILSLPGAKYSSYLSKPTKNRKGIPLIDADVPISINKAIVEMQGVCVRYGDKEILGGWQQEIEGRTQKGLSWTVRRGERWGVFGPNGMCLVVHDGGEFALTATRIRENDTHVFNLL